MSKRINDEGLPNYKRKSMKKGKASRCFHSAVMLSDSSDSDFEVILGSSKYHKHTVY